MHTWYLSQAPQAVPVESFLSCGEFFHITFCHVPHCGEILHMTEKALHVRKSVMWRNDVHNLWCFVSLNCCKILFFGDLCCFVENLLLRFTRFCAEKKLSQKICLWRKMDILYHVWAYVWYFLYDVWSLIIDQCWSWPLSWSLKLS